MADRNRKSLIVSELIAELQKHPDNLLPMISDYDSESGFTHWFSVGGVTDGGVIYRGKILDRW